ncbi:alginate export family protein [Salinimicrobium gaetbulicola]|uniref:Alginate export family protein n=1 Tax=Salinimicrobium gaetbulicola TaxID=999702 RepID=A0ABW3IF21_9FLAO
MLRTVQLLGFLLFTFPLFAQTFETDLQIRPRFEYRNGYKTLLSEQQDGAEFISQRSRINFNFAHEALELKLSLQNVRVWGDVPTMRTADNNGIALFEAYGQYNLSPDFRFKLGRQVLSYDNQRILGEVGWAQQAQSHDAALFTWLPKEKHRLDVGIAVNAPAETLFEVPYTVNSYKNMQFAWYHLDRQNVAFSFLVMNTGYEFTNGVDEQEIDYLQTYGAFHKFSKGSFSGDIAVYGQTGERNDKTVSAWYGGLNLNYKLSGEWKIGAGTEYFSGTDLGSAGNINSFTPLFGTNHAFNGLMDYFFVGNHQNSVGLLDIFGKLTYSKDKFNFMATPHLFSATAELGGEDKYLGTEVDLAAGYKFSKDVAVNIGYSQMFGTDSLEILKGGDSGRTQNWAYVMVNFNPTIFTSAKAD